MIKLHREHTPSAATSRPTPIALGDRFMVVEHEFEGGPYDGRRMTGLACTDDLCVVSSDDASSARLVDGAAPTSRIGTYRYLRAYDCTRTVERVHVYRWHPSLAVDGL